MNSYVVHRSGPQSIPAAPAPGCSRSMPPSTTKGCWRRSRHT
jgi:hypothetical protein